MSNAEKRKERLHKLIDLALAYCSATKSTLANQFERDRSRLYPDTDNPKLDLIIALAEALEWPLDAVVEFIREGNGAPATEADADWETLDKQTLAAHHKGEFAQMVTLAQHMLAAAQTPQQRGRACRLEGAGWEGQGRYTHTLAAIRRGLDVTGLPASERIALQANFAHAYYSLGDLTSARGVAYMLIDYFGKRPPTTRTDRESQAFALYVRGNALRRMITASPDDWKELAGAAGQDLDVAERLYTQMAADYSVDYLGAIAHTCRGALLEVQVELGRREPQAAVDEILVGVGRLDGESPWPEGDWLESYGWWCDFGANIALRHLNGRPAQRTLAILSEKLLAIGRRLGNWALIERAVSIEHAWRGHVAEATGLDVPPTLDSEDLRLLAGTIGRFPQFRRPGWELIETAALIPTLKRN
jgi:hypothetical protein